MKKILLAILLFASLNLVSSQAISFTDMDGTTTEYNLTDVRKITFNSGNVSIYLNNDNIVTLPFDEFKNYQYSEDTLSNPDVIADSNAFLIFPNPTKDVFKIRLDAQSALPYECTIYDVNGRAIFQKDLGVLNGLYSEDISLEKFPSGMYFVELKSGHLKSTEQLIKQ